MCLHKPRTRNHENSCISFGENGASMDIVSSTKFLGLIIDDKLTFQEHIDSVTTKTNSRFHFQLQLKRLGVSSNKLAAFYSCMIRSVILYAIPAFYAFLTRAQIAKLESIQSKCTKVILPHISSYSERLEHLKLPRLDDFMKDLTIRHFIKVLSHSQHPLHHLLPPKQSSRGRHSSRLKAIFTVTGSKKSFFNFCAKAL